MSQKYRIGPNQDVSVNADIATLRDACKVLNRNKHQGRENWEVYPDERDRNLYYGVIAWVEKHTAHQIGCLEAILIAKYYKLAFE